MEANFICCQYNFKKLIYNSVGLIIIINAKVNSHDHSP